MSFRLTSNIAQVRADLQRRASALVQGIAASIEADIKAQFKEPKSGRIYNRSGKRKGRRGKKSSGRRHQASAPGEAPAIDYGNLHNSTRWVSETKFRAIVGSGTDYAELLEFGGAKLKPRPFFGPAFARHRALFEAGMKSLIS